jgi:hypothetical protein
MKVSRGDACVAFGLLVYFHRDGNRTLDAMLCTHVDEVSFAHKQVQQRWPKISLAIARFAHPPITTFADHVWDPPPSPPSRMPLRAP